jgi:hypothetical protein
MNELIVRGNRVTLDPSSMIGKGGEADVYHVEPEVALKVFKGPNHLDIKGLPKGPERDLLARQARERIAEHQTKLPAFPKRLPVGIVSPVDLARDKNGIIRGYTMPLVPNAHELLMLHADKDLRKTLDPAHLITLFLRLHELVGSVHKAGVVIGDFNDLNVLIRKPETSDVMPYLIDADSMQYGGFMCRMFTARFADPLVCDASASVPLLVAPHCEFSDWFAFATMLFETLLWVSPFGGVHRPKQGKKIAHDARSLARVSVLSTDVRYPKPARPYGTLPDDLLQFFFQMFEKDQREVFPRSLLENLRWTTCTDCGYTHARSMCPRCGVADPAISQKVVIRGSVTARRIFPTPRLRGELLAVTFQEGELRYVVHDAGMLKREDGSVVLTTPPTPDMRLRISGKRTFIGQGSRLVVVDPSKSPELLTVDTIGHKPMFDTDATALYRVVNGQLVREGALGCPAWTDDGVHRSEYWLGLLSSWSNLPGLHVHTQEALAERPCEFAGHSWPVSRCVHVVLESSYLVLCHLQPPRTAQEPMYGAHARRDHCRQLRDHLGRRFLALEYSRRLRYDPSWAHPQPLRSNGRRDQAYRRYLWRSDSGACLHRHGTLRPCWRTFVPDALRHRGCEGPRNPSA